MNTEVAAVDPEASLFQIQEFIIENKQRILPVSRRGRLWA